ncbi:MAG: hypothetical protein ACOH5I_11750 [Oligoflexus sp.]
MIDAVESGTRAMMCQHELLEGKSDIAKIIADGQEFCSHFDFRNNAIGSGKSNEEINVKDVNSDDYKTLILMQT